MKTEIHLLVEEALLNESMSPDSAEYRHYVRPFDSFAIDEINNRLENSDVSNKKPNGIGYVVLTKPLDNISLPFDANLIYLNKLDLSNWLDNGLVKPLLKNIIFRNHDVSVFLLYNYINIDTPSANNRIDLLEHVREAFPDQSDILNQYFPDLKVCKRVKTSL